MTICELSNLPQLKGRVHLTAGEQGIGRAVRWVYFADCALDVRKPDEVLQYIHGGELVVFTNADLQEYGTRILGMVKSMMTKRIAGLFITEGQIMPDVRLYCAENDLPLFELDQSFHLIDLSQIVFSALIREQQEMNSVDALLTALLFSGQPESEEIRRLQELLNVSLAGDCRAVCLEVEDSVRKNGSCQAVRSAMQSAGIAQPLISARGNSVIFLVPSSVQGKYLTVMLASVVHQTGAAPHSADARIGVGTLRDCLTGCRESLREARAALRIGRKVGGLQSLQSDGTADAGDSRVERGTCAGKCIYFYEDLGPYALIDQVHDQKFLEDYASRTLGKLLEADRVQDGRWLQTLESYLEHNGSVTETAAALYIHRNTLHYRLERIEQLLGRRLDSLSDLLEMKLAVAAYRML